MASSRGNQGGGRRFFNNDNGPGMMESRVFRNSNPSRAYRGDDDDEDGVVQPSIPQRHRRDRPVPKPKPQLPPEDDNWRNRIPIKILQRERPSVVPPLQKEPVVIPAESNGPSRPRSKPRSRPSRKSAPAQGRNDNAKNLPQASPPQSTTGTLVASGTIVINKSQKLEQNYHSMKGRQPAPRTTTTDKSGPSNSQNQASRNPFDFEIRPEQQKRAPAGLYVPPMNRSDYQGQDRAVNQQYHRQPPPPVQKSSQHCNEKYARVFYTMLDNPELKVRRDPLFHQYEKLSLADQLSEMDAALSLTPEGKQQRLRILDHIGHILKKEYPNCIIFPFGSYLTGIGDATSDVDLYVDAFGVMDGHRLPKFGSGTQDVLERCNQALRRAKCPVSYKVFCKLVIPIREARVPILKMTHWSNVNVDLSFENITSLRNSEMIALYMELDPCVKPLIVLVRYWAKFHCLTGSNHIKNYCLNLMVLVFLAKKNIIPTVTKLQKLRAAGKEHEPSSGKGNEKKISENVHIIDGWDTSFEKNVETIRRECPDLKQTIINEPSQLVDVVLKLLKEFFEMFASLDFNTFVICTNTSEFLPSRLFVAGNEEELSDDFERYKDWAFQQPSNKRLNIRRPMCVQDPFILGFNVGGVTPFGTLLKFQVACQSSITILEEGITSLLQLFVPLPREVGDRKFLSMQDKQRMTIRLKNDVSHFLQFGEFMADLQAEEEQTSEETLGLHLLSVEELIDKNTIRLGRGWETVTLLQPSDSFQAVFVQMMQQNEMHRTISTSTLFSKLKLLWLSIVDDFFKEFWTECFLLNIVSKEEGIKLKRLYADPPFVVRTRKNYEGMFVPQKPRNKRGGRRGQSSAAETITNFSQVQSDQMREKLLSLGEIEEKILCQKLTCTASIPVWRKRNQIYRDITYNLKPNDNKKDETHSRSRMKRKLKNLPSNFANDDPLWIQKKVTSAVLENLGVTLADPKNKSSDPILSFTIFMKTDYSLVDDIPTISLVFEMAGNTHKDIYAQGVSTIVETLTDTFESYTMYKLHKWLNEDADDNETENDPSHKIEDDYDDFDSLMPPTSSSSSECSPTSPARMDDFESSTVTGEWDN